MSPLLKNSRFMKSKLITKYCFQSAILAFFIMLFTLECHSNTLLGGEKTVLRMDLYHQYGPLYSELYDRITSGGSLIFSWTSGLGGGFLGNLFNYCCSPFAFILLILGHENMPEAIALMMLFKAVFASVSFTYYINKTNKPQSISAAFGALYAFCGYFVAYSWNIMWIDAMAIFPLVVLGIRKIIDEKKPWLFIFSLTYTMITNYYMAYMVCILSVFAFLYHFICNYNISSKFGSANTVRPVVFENINAEKTFIGVAASGQTDAGTGGKQKKSLKNNRFLTAGFMFAFSGVLSFLLAAFALVPVFFVLKTSSATSSTFPQNIKIYFNFFDFIANHLPGINPTIRSSGEVVLPNVYCGILTLLLLPFYFLSNKISGRHKIAATVIIALFYLGFSINYLNYIWHGFHFPNDLPYRYSFAYSFFLLSLVYKVLSNAEEFSKKEYTVAAIALGMFVVFVDKLGSTNVQEQTVYLSLVFIVIYAILFGFIKSPHYTKKTVNTLIVFLIAIELCFCDIPNFVMDQPKSNYVSDYDDYCQLKEAVETSDTDLFYRTELARLRTRMDPCWYGYNGVSTFSSMAYENTAALMKSLGLFGNNINSYTYNPQTPVFNSMFGIKYVYDNGTYIENSEYYSEMGANDKFTAYKYNYNLPIAFSVDNTIKSFDKSSSNPFTVQNSLMQAATGVEDIMIQVKATDIYTDNVNEILLSSVNNSTSFYFEKNDKTREGNVKLTIDVTEDGDYAVYAGSTKLSRLKVTAENFSYDYLSSSIQPLVLDVGFQTAGSQILIEYTVDKAQDSGNITFCAVKTDSEKFQEAYNKICSNGLIELDEFNESSFSGKITVTNENGFIYTSIPYDTSWVIKVDGEKLAYYNEKTDDSDSGKIVAVGNGLIGFDISEGEHKITFEYKAKGLKEGILFTFIGIVMLLFFIFFSRKKKVYKTSECLLPEGEMSTGNLENPSAELNSDFTEYDIAADIMSDDTDDGEIIIIPDDSDKKTEDDGSEENNDSEGRDDD